MHAILSAHALHNHPLKRLPRWNWCVTCKHLLSGLLSFEQVRLSTASCYLLKIIATLPLPLLNKNRSELSLPPFATATFGEHLKFVLFSRSRVYFSVSS